VRFRLFTSAGALALFTTARAFADSPSTAAIPAPENEGLQASAPALSPGDVKLEGTATSSADRERDIPVDAPPPEPHRKGFVLDASAGALFFAGQMGKVATPAPHFRVLFGYEPFKWLLVFGRGEMAFSTTANAEDPPYTRAFPLFGFGAGLRATGHLTERVAVYGEGSLGFLKCDIATRALVNLGLPDAEKLKPDVGGRVGIEWYQLDRHYALGIAGGVRLATGLSRLGPKNDTPLLAETQLTLRYTF
jgi:hypothetical protein